MTPNAQHKRAADWQAGDFLKMGDRTYEFIEFEPAYPRAKARDHFGSIAFIDVSRQQPARTNAEHKRAERERRKAAGEVRCEVWLDDVAQKDLALLMKEQGMTKEDVLRTGLLAYRNVLGI